MAVSAHLVCREARTATGGVAGAIRAIVDGGESPAREALRLAARSELLRRELAGQAEPVPPALERAIASLLDVARQLGAQP
jgi:hypothetical protein